MVNVMHDSSNQGRGDIQGVQELGDSRSLEEVGRGVEHIGGVGAVVVGVVRVVVGLYEGEPVLQRLLVAVQRRRDVHLAHQAKTKPYQGPVNESVV